MDETIAVYIDGDNTSYHDMKIILNEIKSYGRIIISRVYGDWSEQNMKNWLETSAKYGIIPIDDFNNEDQEIIEYSKKYDL